MSVKRHGLSAKIRSVKGEGKEVFKKSVVLGIAACLAYAAPSPAAISFSIAGLAGTGVTADVTFTYQSISSTAANILISLTNTTAGSVGGFITGFAFNVPTISGVSFTSIGGDIDNVGAQTTTPLGSPNESGWHARYDVPGGIKTPNGAGDFDFGVLNSSNANPFITGGTGSGSRVIVGETTLFTLALVGTGLNSLSNAIFESTFMSELSTGGNAGAFPFGARFQGLSNDGSDLAVGGPSTTPVVPIPSAALLALLGLGGAGFMKRRGQLA